MNYIFFWLSVCFLSHFERDSSFCHVRSTSVTCTSLSSPAMVPYVCQNVYVVCFFRPDSFPCFLSNEPRSPRGSEPKPHAIYTDRTAGALPAKAARDEEVGGWVENLSWKLQVKPSVSNVSLFTFFDSFVFLCVTFSLPWVSTEWPGQVMFGSGQLHRPTNITHLNVVPRLRAVSPSSLCSFVFVCFVFLLCAADVFFSDTRFLSPLPIKTARCFGLNKKG